MDRSQLRKDQVYFAKVVGCNHLQKVRIMTILSRCATVELIEGGKNGVVKLDHIFCVDQEAQAQ
ncbi:hypothetical protein [Enterococcus mediterraneensis]|uniref:hypothetical protein n=1 Tax=Enterococcus mediterraneensis TaxID=2364791 RepID=UPI000F046521|nr:hypothetical protein [Enterococcus mediterraneensis]